jgi:hypothetical protein
LISNITPALAGEWQLKRDITFYDRHGNKNFGTLNGNIAFTPDDDKKLFVRESGTLSINQSNNDVYRNYIYELKDNRIYILYNDDHRKGDILHELDFITNTNGEITSTHCHLCGQDEYTICFSIYPDNKIIIDYNVRGPHKNYDMHSVLTAQRKNVIREI